MDRSTLVIRLSMICRMLTDLSRLIKRFLTRFEGVIGLGRLRLRFRSRGRLVGFSIPIFRRISQGSGRFKGLSRESWKVFRRNKFKNC